MLFHIRDFVLESSDTTGSMCINVSSGLGQSLSIIGLFKGAIVSGDSKSPYYVLGLLEKVRCTPWAFLYSLPVSSGGSRVLLCMFDIMMLLMNLEVACDNHYVHIAPGALEG